MSFPFDAAARLVNAYRSLNEPIIGLPNIVPIAVLADYTRRSSSEQIESRALAGWQAVAVGGQYQTAQLFAATRPVVIDSLRVTVSGVSGATLNVGVTPIPFVAPVGAQPYLNIGGIAATALLDQGPALLPPSAAVIALPLQNGEASVFPGQEPLRLLIPPNFAFVAGCSVAGVALEWVLLWREVIE